MCPLLQLNRYVSKMELLFPVADDDIDLGSASLEFKDGYFDGTLNTDVLVIGASTGVTSVDTDLSSVSASHDTLASALSIKTYADSVASAAALGTSGDTGTGTVNISTQSLTISGGTGLDSTASGQTVTLAIDSTVATLTGSQTLTNKTLTSPTVNGATLTGALNGSGILTLGAGSAAVPTYSTTGDTNTGLFFPAADALGFSTNGLERFRVDSSGNVGFGTDSPSVGLHQVRNGDSSDLPSISGGTGIIAQSTAGATSSSAISIMSGATATASLFFGDTDNEDAGAITYNHAGDRMEFIVNASERLRIDSSGNLSVGKTVVDNSTPGVSVQGDGFVSAVREWGRRCPL